MVAHQPSIPVQTLEIFEFYQGFGNFLRYTSKLSRLYLSPPIVITLLIYIVEKAQISFCYKGVDPPIVLAFFGKNSQILIDASCFTVRQICRQI